MFAACMLQVFQYDGSQLCTAPEFAVFAIIGLILVAFFIVPTPFLVSYICIRRPQVLIIYNIHDEKNNFITESFCAAFPAVCGCADLWVEAQASMVGRMGHCKTSPICFHQLLHSTPQTFPCSGKSIKGVLCSVSDDIPSFHIHMYISILSNESANQFSLCM